MEFKGLKRNHYTEKWDDALPVGNGTIGGLIFGDPLHEKIATNHEELFLVLPENADSRPYNGFKYLEKTRELLHEHKFREATEYYLNGLRREGAPDYIVWTNPFETAAEIHVDIEGDMKVTDYVQTLDFATGEAVISCKLDGETLTKRCFVSRSRDIMVMSITKEGLPISLDVSLSVNSQACHIEDPQIICEDDNLSLFVTHTQDESGYLATIKAIQNGQGIMAEFDRIHADNVNEILILYTLTPWKKRVEAYKVKLVRLLDMINTTYLSLFKEHEIIHRELFERVSVSFSDDNGAATNEELISECTKYTLSVRLLERMADFGRYLEISSFGKLPPNLQGVWNGSVCPPWSSDYTLDENIQMMMWQVMPGGLSEFALKYFDWLEGYVEEFKVNAKSYYGCRGIFAAARVSSDGYHRHFEERWPMVFWTAGAGWLSQVYQDYYEYTLDENVLMRGVRFWKEIVLFYEDFLITDENGKYEFAPSFSPENIPLGNDSPTAINATMDVAVAKEVYKNLIGACEILGIEEDNLSKWKEEYRLFPDYAINEDKALKEWIPEFLKDDYHHRHSSHLYPVFPGHEALENGNEELLAACHKAAELRLLDGVDAISGWGLAHLANISARLKDSNLWYLALNRLIGKFTLNNLFTGHNEHDLFQMDANLGITAAVIEAFSYSDMEKIELFPILCDRYEYMKAEGLRAKGSIHIARLEKRGNVVFADLDNQGRKTMRIVCPQGYSFENGDRECEIAPGERAELKAVKRN